MAKKITKLTYSGAGQVYAQDGLSDVIRKLAQDLGKTKLGTVSDLTDNSTGTASGTPYKLEAQAGETVAAFTETGTASAPKAGFDTALGKVGDAMAVIVARIAALNTALALDAVTDNTGGNVAVAGTIAALDKSLTAANTSLVDVTTGRQVLEVTKVNMARLANISNRIAVATGFTKINVSPLGNNGDGSSTLDAISATGSAVDGTSDSTIANSVVGAELTAIANNIATIAAHLNSMIGTTGQPLQVVAWDA